MTAAFANASQRFAAEREEKLRTALAEAGVDCLELATDDGVAEACCALPACANAAVSSPQAPALQASRPANHA